MQFMVMSFLRRNRYVTPRNAWNRLSRLVVHNTPTSQSASYGAKRRVVLPRRITFGFSVDQIGAIATHNSTFCATATAEHEHEPTTPPVILRGVKRSRRIFTQYPIACGMDSASSRSMMRVGAPVIPRGLHHSVGHAGLSSCAWLLRRQLRH